MNGPHRTLVRHFTRRRERPDVAFLHPVGASGRGGLAILQTERTLTPKEPRQIEVVRDRLKKFRSRNAPDISRHILNRGVIRTLALENPALIAAMSTISFVPTISSSEQHYQD